jgi:hypothetical protein
VAFAIERTGEIGAVDAFWVGQGAYLSRLVGVNRSEAVVKFGYPPLTPQTSLIVTILSKGDIRVTGIKSL